MSQNEISSAINQLRELKRFQEDIAAEIEELTTQIKNHMDAARVDTLSGNDWKVTYKTVTSSRLDTSALKKALPDIAAQYTKTTTSRRFVLA